jgi:bifunctional UDP-N-acetylglucosamine pyrophosphorylase/glucosamine-1-phosphate N-acetyltransferase
VIGHGADQVREIFRGDDDDLVWVVQDRQLGTGHATDCARSVLKDLDGDVLVLAGDGPLIRPEILGQLVERHRKTAAAATLATAIVDEPTGYGRIIRDEQGRFTAIVEHASATESQRLVREIYPSYACFDAGLLFDVLETLPPDAQSGEYRVTDVPGVMSRMDRAVELVNGFPPEDVLSINTTEQLDEVDAILSSRLEIKR